MLDDDGNVEVIIGGWPPAPAGDSGSGNGNDERPYHLEILPGPDPNYPPKLIKVYDDDETEDDDDDDDETEDDDDDDDETEDDDDDDETEDDDDNDDDETEDDDDIKEEPYTDPFPELQYNIFNVDIPVPATKHVHDIEDLLHLPKKFIPESYPQPINERVEDHRPKTQVKDRQAKSSSFITVSYEDGPTVVFAEDPPQTVVDEVASCGVVFNYNVQEDDEKLDVPLEEEVEAQVKKIQNHYMVPADIRMFNVVDDYLDLLRKVGRDINFPLKEWTTNILAILKGAIMSRMERKYITELLMKCLSLYMLYNSSYKMLITFPIGREILHTVNMFACPSIVLDPIDIVTPKIIDNFYSALSVSYRTSIKIADTSMKALESVKSRVADIDFPNLVLIMKKDMVEKVNKATDRLEDLITATGGTFVKGAKGAKNIAVVAGKSFAQFNIAAWGKITDFGKSTGNALTRAGKSTGKAVIKVVDVSKKAGEKITDFGKSTGEAFTKVIDVSKKAGEKVGPPVGKFFKVLGGGAGIVVIAAGAMFFVTILSLFEDITRQPWERGQPKKYHPRYAWDWILHDLIGMPRFYDQQLHFKPRDPVPPSTIPSVSDSSLINIFDLMDSSEDKPLMPFSSGSPTPEEESSSRKGKLVTLSNGYQFYEYEDDEDVFSQKEKTERKTKAPSIDLNKRAPEKPLPPSLVPTFSHGKMTIPAGVNPEYVPSPSPEYVSPSPEYVSPSPENVSPSPLTLPTQFIYPVDFSGSYQDVANIISNIAGALKVASVEAWKVSTKTADLATQGMVNIYNVGVNTGKRTLNRLSDITSTTSVTIANKLKAYKKALDLMLESYRQEVPSVIDDVVTVGDQEDMEIDLLGDKNEEEEMVDDADVFAWLAEREEEDKAFQDAYRKVFSEIDEMEEEVERQNKEISTPSKAPLRPIVVPRKKKLPVIVPRKKKKNISETRIQDKNIVIDSSIIEAINKTTKMLQTLQDKSHTLQSYPRPTTVSFGNKRFDIPPTWRSESSPRVVMTTTNVPKGTRVSMGPSLQNEVFGTQYVQVPSGTFVSMGPNPILKISNKQGTARIAPITQEIDDLSNKVNIPFREYMAQLYNLFPAWFYRQYKQELNDIFRITQNISYNLFIANVAIIIASLRSQSDVSYLFQQIQEWINMKRTAPKAMFSREVIQRLHEHLRQGDFLNKTTVISSETDDGIEEDNPEDMMEELEKRSATISDEERNRLISQIALSEIGARDNIRQSPAPGITNEDFTYNSVILEKSKNASEIMNAYQFLAENHVSMPRDISPFANETIQAALAA